MNYKEIFRLGFKELFNTRLRIMFSTNDLAWYARKQYTREYNPDTNTVGLRQINLANNQPISEAMREVRSKVLNLAEFTKEETLRIVKNYLLQNKSKMEYIFHISVDLKELPEELQTLLNSKDPALSEDIIDIIIKVDNLISQVLNTPTLPHLNKYLVYITEPIHPDIKELLERFNKSFQQHQRKLKSLQPAELEHFVFNEVWDLWFKDKPQDIVNTAKITYLYLLTEQQYLLNPITFTL